MVYFLHSDTPGPKKTKLMAYFMQKDVTDDLLYTLRQIHSAPIRQELDGLLYSFRYKVSKKDRIDGLPNTIK